MRGNSVAGRIHSKQTVFVEDEIRVGRAGIFHLWAIRHLTLAWKQDIPNGKTSSFLRKVITLVLKVKFMRVQRNNNLRIMICNVPEKILLSATMGQFVRRTCYRYIKNSSRDHILKNFRPEI